jgi:hypothetical protein
MSTVWKDAGMLAFFIVSAAFLYGATMEKNQKTRYSSLVIGIIAGCVACSFRHNGVFAFAPLLVLVFFIPSKRFWWKSAVFTTSLLAATVFGKVINNVGVEEKVTHMENILFAWDLSGISVAKNELKVPEYALLGNAENSLEAIKENYDRRSCNGVIFGEQIFNPLIWADATLGERFRSDAVKIIGSNATPYIEHRWRYTKGLLFGDRWWPNQAYCFSIGKFPGDEKLGLKELTMLNPTLLEKVERALAPAVHFKAFTAAPYLFMLCTVLALSLLAIFRNWRKPKLSVLSGVMAMSGLVYWFPYVVLGPADDFRYTSWTAFCAVSSAVVLVSWYIHNKRDSYTANV